MTKGKDTKKKKPSTAEDETSPLQQFRTRLSGLPYSKASDLKKASDDIRQRVWERLETARILSEMSEKEEYRFVREEFEEGLKCQYGDSPDYLVKVYSPGKGIKVDINKDLVKDIPHSAMFVETLIRSTSDTFSKSYYQARGILAPSELTVDELVKSMKKMIDGSKG